MRFSSYPWYSPFRKKGTRKGFVRESLSACSIWLITLIFKLYKLLFFWENNVLFYMQTISIIAQEIISEKGNVLEGSESDCFNF